MSPITSELLHLIELAVEEYYLVQITEYWREHSIFVSHRPDKADFSMWSWINLVLEIDVNKQVLHHISDSSFNKILLKAELRFILSKRNLRVQMTEPQARYRLNRMKKELNVAYNNNVPLFIFIINQWLLTGSSPLSKDNLQYSVNAC